MKLNKLNSSFIAVIILISVAFTESKVTPMYFEIPKKWPKTVYDFKNNQLTEEGFELGRNLFYDPLFSRDSTISCASCHLQATGFTHVDHDLSHGIEGKIGTRNALTLQNLAWSKDFMWDGGVNHLDVQALAPITSEVEMNETLQNVVAKLQKSTQYKTLFYEAFGTKKITGQLTLKALTQFVVALKTTNSKYDKVVRNEDRFSPSEQKGYDLFKKNCASCHIEPLFNSPKFENNGLEVDNTLNDFGRMKITQNPKDSLKFKVPTLRNVEFTFPYMHDGRLKTLTEVVKHYNSNIKPSNTLSKELRKPMHLSDNDRVDLIAFLKTLTDKSFLFDQKFGYPKKK
ncbi:MAG: cytochrome c peroxidase [Flavobacterium sp.]|nr:cytochrome c peroxidase [Flavobacterium sp.]